MSKVELVKNGRKVVVDSRVADHLLSRASYGYIRRDMVAAQPQVPAAPKSNNLAPDKKEGESKPVVNQASKPDVEKPNTVHTSSSEKPEIDSEGVQWDADKHTSNKAKTTAGAWKKKPGASNQK